MTNFFRLIDLAAAVLLAYAGSIVVTVSEEPFPFAERYSDGWLSVLGWFLIVCGVVGYVLIRRLPTPAHALDDIFGVSKSSDAENLSGEPIDDD